MPYYVDNAMNRRLGRVGLPHGAAVHDRDTGTTYTKYYTDNSYNRSIDRVGLPHGSAVVHNRDKSTLYNYYDRDYKPAGDKTKYSNPEEYHTKEKEGYEEDYPRAKYTERSEKSLSWNGDRRVDKMTDDSNKAYKVFSPNEKKRQQLLNQAREETVAHEQYKRQHSEKCYQYIGAVGGGDLTERQVRDRQAIAVRDQKLHRLTRERELKETIRKQEEDKIEAKKAEARKKAEQNLLREGRVPDKTELRNKRDHFLCQLEKDGSMKEHQNNDRASESKPFAKYSLSTHATGRKTHSYQSSQVDATAGSRSTSISEKQTTSNMSHTTSKMSHIHEKQQKPKSPANNGRSLHVDKELELDVCCSMFPDIDRDTVKALLSQMGTVDDVVELLKGDVRSETPSSHDHESLRDSHTPPSGRNSHRYHPPSEQERPGHKSLQRSQSTRPDHESFLRPCSPPLAYEQLRSSNCPSDAQSLQVDRKVELDLCCSVFPRVGRDTVSALLSQMGTADAVIDLLAHEE